MVNRRWKIAPQVPYRNTHISVSFFFSSSSSLPHLLLGRTQVSSCHYLIMYFYASIYCMYVCMHVCIYMYVCLYVCMRMYAIRCKDQRTHVLLHTTIKQ